jgi:hypothetical protein
MLKAVFSNGNHAIEGFPALTSTVFSYLPKYSNSSAVGVVGGRQCGVGGV